ncbi:hypothetical protein PoMZ_12487 [Pyricularia oryzae]|uniref:Uncharacterized protein n=1 Tax=Pyricularia oryzae TaxID=318829 RepID=A0A4P7NSS0_PYROR|nr:hypothetical protein PoMZ_12487 [Pyricularia oryzae]
MDWILLRTISASDSRATWWRVERLSPYLMSGKPPGLSQLKSFIECEMYDADILGVVGFDVVQDIGYQKYNVVFRVEAEVPPTGEGETLTNWNADAVELQGNLSRFTADPEQRAQG